MAMPVEMNASVFGALRCSVCVCVKSFNSQLISTVDPLFSLLLLKLGLLGRSRASSFVRSNSYYFFFHD